MFTEWRRSCYSAMPKLARYPARLLGQEIDNEILHTGHLATKPPGEQVQGEAAGC